MKPVPLRMCVFTRWTRYRMLIPRVMKGLEKSMTFSLSEVMVKPATARSAFCTERERGVSLCANELA